MFRSWNQKTTDETAEYFGEEYPYEHLLEDKLKVKIPHTEYHEDMKEGYEIVVSHIPKGVYKIRFYNSY